MDGFFVLLFQNRNLPDFPSFLGIKDKQNITPKLFKQTGDIKPGLPARVIKHQLAVKRETRFCQSCNNRQGFRGKQFAV
jgi:hypothetical protein